MKTLKIKHAVLMPVFTFLKNATLKGKATRGRTQLLKRLEEKNKDFNEAVTEIRKTHFECDENGELIIENEQYLPLSKELADEANEMVAELVNEDFEINFGEYSTLYEALFLALDNLDAELTGDEAYGYSELMDAHEANTNTEEK